MVRKCGSTYGCRPGHGRPAGIRAQVRATIAAGLAAGKPAASAAFVADALGMNKRTLQRRLASEGTRFRDLLEGCRRDEAVNCLVDRGMPVHAVSARLGYSQPAHFARAFRRWTGRSPSDYAGNGPPADEPA